MDRTLISVIIPTWNAAGYLPETLDSVLAQTYEPIEVIVVDDGSTDDTAAVVARYGERIRYIAQANSGGPARPRNVAIAAALGDLIAMFDADDIMEKEKLEAAATAFAAYPAIDLLFTNFRAIDESGAPLVDDYLEPYTRFRDHLQPTDDPRFNCRGPLGDRPLFPGKNRVRTTHPGELHRHQQRRL